MTFAWASAMGQVQAAFADAHPFGRCTVGLGSFELDVLVAETPQQWARGLVGQRGDDGMLFIMPAGSRAPFAMRGVDEPIGIAFFGEDQVRVDIGVMDAQKGFRWPRTAYRYVLEIPLRNHRGMLALLGESGRLELR